jgi:hypothetical protein
MEKIMETIQLAKNDWQPYFDRVSKSLGSTQAEIEVNSHSLGDQIAARWSPLQGISYDPKDDILAVFMDGLEHMVHHPQSIFVEQDQTEFKSMDVLGEEDTHHIVRIRKA